MGFFIKTPGERAIKILMVIIALISPMKGVVAEELKSFFGSSNLKNLQKKYLFLEAQTKDIKTHAKGIDAAKVKECIKTLKAQLRVIGMLERQAKEGEKDKEKIKRITIAAEKYRTVVKAIMKVFELLFQFELKEDYLRKNISDKNIFINVKGYIESALLALNEFGKIEYSEHSKEIFGLLNPKLKELQKHLFKELYHDLKRIGYAVFLNGTDAQQKAWVTFTLNLDKRFPDFKMARLKKMKPKK